MSAPAFAVRPLGKERRGSFDCGQVELDRYFHTQISQDVRRKVTSAFIAVHQETQAIAGFYTLSACQVNLSELDEDWRKKLPLYPTVPAALLGRLAIDRAYQKRGLGAAMLADAASRAMQSDVAVAMLIADAKDDDAAAFYLRHGMRTSPNQSNRLFVPIATLARKFNR